MNVLSPLPVRSRRLGLGLLTALIATGAASADDRVTAVVGARVFDGSRALPKATVLIARGKITAVLQVLIH